MFNWLFKPTCPCDSAAKEWIEDRLRFLAYEFPDSAFSGRSIVLPTQKFFPDPYDSSQAAVRTLLERVCYYMDAEPESIGLKFIGTATSTFLVNESGQAIANGVAGLYESEENLYGEREFTVSIDKNQLHDPMSLVGTIAHELAHVRLMGEDRVTGEEFDNELLTDLTVVHFGLGIFLANAPRNWDSSYTKWPDTELLKPEYMSPPMFGWAMAHLALFRDEKHPAWASYLKTGPKTNLYQGIRYMNATDHSTYKP